MGACVHGYIRARVNVHVCVRVPHAGSACMCVCAYKMCIRVWRASTKADANEAKC